MKRYIAITTLLLSFVLLVAACGSSDSAPPPAVLSVTPTAHDYGFWGTGTTSPPFDFTVTNEGGSTSGTIVTSVTGTNAVDFHITADTCAGTTLASSATCTVSIEFYADLIVNGHESAELKVSATPGGATQAALSGDGT